MKLARTAELLRQRGHEPIFAVQQIGAVEHRRGGADVWQAPLWPQQLTLLARRAGVGPSTMGDILVALGLGDVDAVSAMLGAWDGILRAARPDAIAAEFAPALMLAARGRIPLVSLGTGFSLPPAQTSHFPSLTGQPPLHDERKLLAVVNEALGRHARAPLDALPQIFAADRTVPAAFRELDPYRDVRIEAHGTPSLSGAIAASAGDGDELFVYMNGSQPRLAAFWNGLARSGVPIRLYDARLTPADRDTLERAGLTVETRQIPFDRIVERSRIVMSHGGMGFTSSALLAGIPHIVTPFDLEKRLISAGLREIGLGLEIAFEDMDADRFAAQLRAAMADQSLVDRARAAAPFFRERMVRSCEEEIAEAIEGLL